MVPLWQRRGWRLLAEVREGKITTVLAVQDALHMNTRIVVVVEEEEEEKMTPSSHTTDGRLSLDVADEARRAPPHVHRYRNAMAPYR